MSSSIGIYCLTDVKSLGQLPSIVAKLQQEYDSHLLGSWRLDYRLMRSVASPQQQKPPSLQHVLHLSSEQRRVFIGIENGIYSNGVSGKRTSFALTSIPAPYATQYNNLLTSKMSAIWSPRLALALNGMTWEVGSTILSLGELRAPGSTQSSQIVRALVVAFETKLEETVDESMSEDAHEAIKAKVSEMAQKIGIENAKEYWGYGKQANIIQTWCEALPH